MLKTSKNSKMEEISSSGNSNEIEGKAEPHGRPKTMFIFESNIDNLGFRDFKEQKKGGKEDIHFWGGGRVLREFAEAGGETLGKWPKWAQAGFRRGPEEEVERAIPVWKIEPDQAHRWTIP